MDNPRVALPGWCSASGRLSRSGQLKRSARRLSDVGLGTSGTGAERSWEYRFNPCENRLTPRQNAQQIPDDREVGTRPSFHHVTAKPGRDDHRKPQRRGLTAGRAWRGSGPIDGVRFHGRVTGSAPAALLVSPGRLSGLAGIDKPADIVLGVEPVVETRGKRDRSAIGNVGKQKSRLT